MEGFLLNIYLPVIAVSVYIVMHTKFLVMCIVVALLTYRIVATFYVIFNLISHLA